MIYIIDTNILSHASRDHFPIPKNSNFWDWLKVRGEDGEIRIPEWVGEEVGIGTDGVPAWLAKNKEVLLLKTSDVYAVIPQVVQAYEDLSENGIDEESVEQLKADPYVVAHALILGATVVTDEHGKAGRLTNYKEVKVPHVCAKLGVPCIKFPRFLWDLRATLPE